MSIKNRKKLVIVPHSDDEILLAGGLIHDACLSHEEIRVAVVTNGDYKAKDTKTGETRLRESLNALELLGVPEENIYFFGYADTGMPASESFLFSLYNEKDEERIHKSFVTTETYALPEHPDFHYLRHGEHQKYTRSGFTSDLEEFLFEYLPDEIYTTSFYELHGDHSGLFLFVRDALKKLSEKEKDYSPKLFTSFIHSVDGDDKWPLIRKNSEKLDSFTKPLLFDKDTDLDWDSRIDLPVPEDMRTTDLEKNLKNRAMLCYKSALKPEEPEVIAFLLSFVKSDEIFFKVNIKE